MEQKVTLKEILEASGTTEDQLAEMLCAETTFWVLRRENKSPALSDDHPEHLWHDLYYVVCHANELRYKQEQTNG